MSKKMMSLVAAGLLVAAAAYASDAWKDKDFQNWDQKDVQKILSDSPWAKKFEFESGGGGGGGRGRGMNAPGGSMGDVGGPGGGGGAADTPGHSASGPSGPQGSGQQTNLTVTWFSARTIREAMARQKELAGTPPDDARKGLSEEPTVYEVEVSGSNLMAFGRSREDDLKEHSYLMSKTTKEKLAPAKVIIQRGQDGGRPVAIIFEFAKTTDSGAPTIAKNEKGVEFFTQAGSSPVKVQFDLSKMADKQGADF
jgi:hypothetical protein